MHHPVTSASLVSYYMP